MGAAEPALDDLLLGRLRGVPHLMPLHDVHCHFFSRQFFDTLARQRPGAARRARGTDVVAELGWDDPGSPADLADRWVGELDRHGVGRAVLIASVPGDEASVAEALARHPRRFVGFFMLDPTRRDAAARARQAVTKLKLRGICLFPAMHHYRLDDRRVRRVVEIAGRAGLVVFVHCGVLSVGVRKKLGLPSAFDLRLGDPLAVQALTARFPHVRFIIPHFGAGLFREALMAADACPNIHLDTSSSNAWIRYHPGLTLAGVFRQALAVAGPDRLLFGTDSSFFPRGWQRAVWEGQRAALAEAGADESTSELIFGGNFERLFPAG